MIQTASSNCSTANGPRDGGAWERACVENAQAGDAAAFGDRQFRGADVHAAVKLHRVGVDNLYRDLSTEFLGDGQRQV